MGAEESAPDNLIYGKRPVAELLRNHPEQISCLWVTERSRKSLEQLPDDIPVHVASREDLDQMTGGAAHQGVVAARHARQSITLEQLSQSALPPHGDGLLVALDQVQDPQNLGAVLRLVETVGVPGVIVPARHSAPLSPAARKASAGASELIDVVRVKNLAQALASLKKQGWWIIAAATGDDAVTLYDADVPMPAVIVFGSEGHGIRPLVQRGCDMTISIPLQGKVESLNVSQAVSVVLFELLRRRLGEVNHKVMASNKKRELVFSGVQPSASQVHLGNYMGAMKRFVSLSEKHDTMVCIVDLHALTTVNDPAVLRDNTISLAAAYLAIGIDPTRSIIFRQSDVPEVCELTWYLTCVFPLGLLERAHSVKDARAKQQSVNAGVMYYPILMAADILLYRATKIPVGADQKQHIEMAREVVQKFETAYGSIFPMPEPLIDESTGVIIGLDGRKMSKSYNNYIGLFEPPKKVRKKIMQIVTDSKTVEESKDPDDCNVFQLYRLFATESEQAELRDRYTAGGMGYGHAKEELFNVVEREIAPVRESYDDWMSRQDDLIDVIRDGAQRAADIAGETLSQVRDAVGTATRLR